jgi:hypothetical protein
VILKLNLYIYVPKVIKNARRIPKATVTSNKEDIEPLIDLGLHSERYRGTIADRIPIPAPTTTRPEDFEYAFVVISSIVYILNS